MGSGYEYRGSRHCEAVEVMLRLSRPAAEQQLRAVSGPDGQVCGRTCAGLDLPAFAGLDADQMAYDGETADARRARRRAYWMPITIEQANAPLAPNG